MTWNTRSYVPYVVRCDLLTPFKEVWLVDFEFSQPPGELPRVICMVARELFSGRLVRLWYSDFDSTPPFNALARDVLVVAYYASAECGCFLALGWPVPVRILDLFTEFRCLTNGWNLPSGASLLGALTHYGLPSIVAAEKSEMRDLAIRGGPFTDTERAALLDYCQSDVDALHQLLPRMLPAIDLPRALLRGRYMAAVARMEQCGVPIDTETLGELRAQWSYLKRQLIRRIDREYGVFVPSNFAKLNPASAQDGVIIQAAEEFGVDGQALKNAARQLVKAARATSADYRQALAAARMTSGLTVGRIRRWEDAGKDHSTYPHFDVLAREIAAEYPELGIGRGYQSDGNYDDADYPGVLWNILREADPKPPKLTDEDILREAAALVDGYEAAEQFEELSFSAAKFAEWLNRHDIPWPRTVSGSLALDDETFRQMARAHPEVAPLRELRHALGEMRLFTDLAVGADGRNRCLLSPFRARSSRNAPSNARFIFGPSCWLRGLIKPAEGRAVAYIDWSQQEFGIAAVLSEDSVMVEAYSSGDPYLAFAKQAGAVPPDATKQSHGKQREQYKVCSLAVQYGMGEESLAAALGTPPVRARQLLKAHRDTYPRFWAWAEAAINRALLLGELHTVFGWRIHLAGEANPRSLQNFPVQANGAEMLRLACCLATERGVAVCAPVHDAVMIEADIGEIDEVVTLTQEAMAEASRVVLSGFELRSDVNVVRYPDRYMDPRGERMWAEVSELLNLAKQEAFSVEEW